MGRTSLVWKVKSTAQRKLRLQGELEVGAVSQAEERGWTKGLRLEEEFGPL